MAPTCSVSASYRLPTVPVRCIQELWRQRLQERVPLQYLTATAHWRDLVLAVGPGTLIPRPETEQLVDLAAAAVRESPELAAGHWVDLGTGSGALALGLASVLAPSAQARWPAMPPAFSYNHCHRASTSETCLTYADGSTQLYRRCLALPCPSG